MRLNEPSKIIRGEVKQRRGRIFGQICSLAKVKAREARNDYQLFKKRLHKNKVEGNDDISDDDEPRAWDEGVLEFLEDIEQKKAIKMENKTQEKERVKKLFRLSAYPSNTQHPLATAMHAIHSNPEYQDMVSSPELASSEENAITIENQREKLHKEKDNESGVLKTNPMIFSSISYIIKDVVKKYENGGRASVGSIGNKEFMSPMSAISAYGTSKTQKALRQLQTTSSSLFMLSQSKSGQTMTPRSQRDTVSREILDTSPWCYQRDSITEEKAISTCSSTQPKEQICVASFHEPQTNTNCPWDQKTVSHFAEIYRRKVHQKGFSAFSDSESEISATSGHLSKPSLPLLDLKSERMARTGDKLNSVKYNPPRTIEGRDSGMKKTLSMWRIRIPKQNHNKIKDIWKSKLEKGKIIRDKKSKFLDWTDIQKPNTRKGTNYEINTRPLLPNPIFGEKIQKKKVKSKAKPKSYYHVKQAFAASEHFTYKGGINI